MKILKSTSISHRDSIIVIGSKKMDLSKFGLNENELKYINDKIDNDDKNILINQFSRFVILSILDDDKVEYKRNEIARKSANKLHSALNSEKLSKVTLIDAEENHEAVKSFAEGLALSNYQFLEYFNEKDLAKKKNSLEEIYIHCDSFKNEDGQELQNIIDSVYLARTLINRPLNKLNAQELADIAKEECEKAGCSVEIFNKTKIEALKMGGLLAVNYGSIDPPTFTIIEWKPDNATNNKPYALVGKGVVYDTGGLSLKPTGDSMDYMKSDMGGSAAVIGAMKAIASNKLPIHVVAFIPATDNRPDGNAYAPGDVIKMYDGTTVEVLNTDAEGRMILADAHSYAKEKYDPQLVIDVATLTGAAARAFSNLGIAAMGNDDGNYMAKMKEAGNNVYERIAEMPFWDDYAEMLKSDIADMKNIGGAEAGAITAGKFLEHFAAKPYIHMDIAGPAFNKKGAGYWGKGASGVGVRILYNFFKNL